MTQDTEYEDANPKTNEEILAKVAEIEKTLNTIKESLSYINY